MCSLVYIVLHVCLSQSVMRAVQLDDDWMCDSKDSERKLIKAIELKARLCPLNRECGIAMQHINKTKRSTSKATTTHVQVWHQKGFIVRLW